ncbi:hypothetical protein Tco_0143555 [Tanacetum coccineum]
MEQPHQIIPADQLVTTKYQGIGRCNNYAVLPNIPCPKECKIVGQLLVDHPLRYALTATADVLAVYLQQFWKSVKPVVISNETIQLKVDRHEITYTVNMFCAILKLPVETHAHPYIAPATLKFIQPFLKIVGYHGIVDKVSAFFMKNLAQPWQTMFKVFNRCLTSRTSGHDQTKINIIQIFHVYPRFTKLIIADLMKKFDSIPQRLEEDYHSIKDDIPFMRVVGVDVPTIQPQLIESTQGANRTPRATRTPDPEDVGQKKRKSKQVAGKSSLPRKSLKVAIKQKKPISIAPLPPSDDTKRDDIAEATLLSLALHKTIKIAKEEENVAKLVDSIFLNDEEDSGTRLEPRSHKENPKTVDDDDEEEKKDDKKDDDNDNDDHDDHALVRNKVTSSLEVRNEKIQTPIPSPPRSPRTGLSSDKTISQELMATIALNATNDIIKDSLKRVVVDTVIQERDSLQAENNLITVHPTTSTSNATTTSVDLQQQLYLKMKRNLQDQADDPELWDVLKRKFEKSYVSHTSCRDDAFRKRDHDGHQEYDAPPEREKRAKRQKISKGLKSASGSSSRVIWERVHEFHLGIESYQIKINLTAPTLIFPGIEARDPYFIVNKPTTGLIYLNGKEEKRDMYLVEIIKFCNATLERVLNEVKLKIFETEFLKKAPLLGGLDLDIMKAYEREITKCLKHREQMRIWEPFVNERLILSTMRC